MSFLDKAKEKATALTNSVKEKIDDVKDNRKADDLLDDLGRITYRAHTDRAEPNDEAAIAELVAALKALEDEGTPVLSAKEKAEEPALPPPAPLAPPAPAAD